MHFDFPVLENFEINFPTFYFQNQYGDFFFLKNNKNTDNRAKISSALTNADCNKNYMSLIFKFCKFFIYLSKLGCCKKFSLFWVALGWVGLWRSGASGGSEGREAPGATGASGAESEPSPIKSDERCPPPIEHFFIL